MGVGLLSLIAGVGLAAAAPPRAPSIGDAAVIWSAPGGCPDDDAIEQRIATLVGEPPISTPATAQVRHAGDHYEAVLITWIDGGSQQRELSASTCTALADAVAVVIAVAVDPVVTVRRAPAVAFGVRTAASEADRGGIMRADRRSNDRERKPLQIGFALGMGYGSGIAQPGSAVSQLAIELGGVGRTLGWGFVLDGRLWLPNTFTRSGAPASVRTMLGTIGALGCAKGLAGRVEVPVCLGVEVGGFRANSRSELSSPSTRTYPWVAPRLRLGVRVALARRVGLWTSAEGAAALARARVDVLTADGSGTVALWKTQPVSVRVMLGLDFRWVR